MLTTEESEQNLVARARHGDDEAFDKLVERYRRRIFNLCFDILGSAEDAEDTVQTTWIQAYRSLHDFRGDAAFITWLWSIARNACNNTLRARMSALGRKTTSLDDRENRRRAELPDPQPSLEEQMLNSSPVLLEIVIARARGRWDKIDHDLFLLYYGERMTYEQIARMLSLPASTLRSRKRDHIQPVLDEIRQDWTK